jgi:hypothetical protein
MYSNLKGTISLLLMVLFLNGCGDLLGTKVVKRQLDSSQFEVQCELDMNKFTDIMVENISSQIRCLGENLNLFIKVVKSGKPGYLSRIQLEQYLAKYRPDVKPEVVKGLKSIFDIGHLITGEDPEFISKETVDKVINFALVFNQEAALNFGPIFQNESPVSFPLHQNHRDRVSAANKAIIQSLRSIFNPNRNGQIHKLDIVTLFESFSNESNRENIEKAKRILFLKKVFLGGESEIITHNELEKLILNFDHLLLIGLDIVRYKYIILKQESILQILKRDINDLYNIINQGPLGQRDAEILFTVNDVIEAAKIFIGPVELDLDKFRNLIGEVKKVVIDGNSSDVTGVELKKLFSHAKSLLQTGTVFHRIYDKFKAQLDSPKPVEESINFDEYRHTYPEHQVELDQFERITKKYRFMKGEFLSPYYMKGSKRNPDAIFEIALFEYGIRLILSKFGDVSPNPDSVGGYSIDKIKMQKLIKMFEKELVELDLFLPGRGIPTADNISLLGTLFQYQSDKNKVMDTNEATEFAVSLLASLNIREDLFTFMQEKNCTIDRFDRVEPACFKANFWKGLCTYYRNYFPSMFNSLNAPKKCEDFENTKESAILLGRADEAVRTCSYYTDGNKEEIFYSKGDFMTILLALMHAETTILRWDDNHNNVMDPHEVEKAYDIYAPALDGFLEDKSPIIKKFKKQIFQYMIKYEQVPDEKDFGSIWKFVKFLMSFDKKSPAYRKTIVAVLKVIGDESKKIQDIPFNCNLLRDPDIIPRGDIDEFAKIPALEISIATQSLNPLEETQKFMNLYSTEDKEIIKRELLAFSEEMQSGKISKVRFVRQTNLRMLFNVILRDKAQMRSIRAAIPQGPDVHRIGLAVSLTLSEEN